MIFHHITSYCIATHSTKQVLEKKNTTREFRLATLRLGNVQVPAFAATLRCSHLATQHELASV